MGPKGGAPLGHEGVQLGVAEGQQFGALFRRERRQAWSEPVAIALAYDESSTL
jgi:hypothetical protein